MPFVMPDGARLNPLWTVGNQIPKIILRVKTDTFSTSICLETIQQFQSLIVDADILTDAYYSCQADTVDSVLLVKWVLIWAEWKRHILRSLSELIVNYYSSYEISVFWSICGDIKSSLFALICYCMEYFLVFQKLLFYWRHHFDFLSNTEMRVLIFRCLLKSFCLSIEKQPSQTFVSVGSLTTSGWWWANPASWKCAAHVS